LEYLELTITNLQEEQAEILVSLLSEEGFESFAEENDTLTAYIPVPLFDEQKIEPLLKRFSAHATRKIIPEQNWNAVWESQYEPVLIMDRCFIRAPFHESRPGMQYEIIIEPKMSFGTAHHETTSLMIELMLETGMKGKRVLDMGCGTGILAILAAKSGAASVVAIDNDEWSCRNSLENMEKNNQPGIRVILGDAKDINNYPSDVILANINRNILLEQIPSYAGILSRGDLLLSGFYEEDLPSIRTRAEESGFRLEKYLIRNQWIAAKFRK
jgi:ribosomal protein L11 methyltransferase